MNDSRFLFRAPRTLASFASFASFAFALSFLAVVAATPAAASDFPATVQWVLTSAKALGAGNPQPQFVTSLRIVNPNSVAANVDLTYLPQSPFDSTDPNNYVVSGDNGGRTAVRVTVGANRTLALEDVVTATFGDPAPFGVHAGGIKVVSDVPVSAFSRTFVSNGQSSTGVPGTFGISIPAVVSDLAVSAGDTAFLPYAAANPSTTTGFRSNLILLNTSTGTSVVHVRVLKADGTTVGERDYTFARLAQSQQGRLPDSFGYQGPDENLTAVVTVKSGGPVAVGLTPIDNAISSQNFTGPSKVFAPNNGAFGLVLDDNGYGFGGRLDLLGGQADFLSAGIVLTECPAPNPVLVFFVQAFGSGTSKNTTFTRDANGSWSFQGGTASATWIGQAFPDVDGTLFGSITYQRTASASCGGVSRQITFSGARAERFATAP
jgi:hypothetical protein